MRWSKTPPTWRPQGPVFRQRSMDEEGYPWILGSFAVGLLGVAAYSAQHQLVRIQLGVSLDEGALGVGLAALVAGLVCAYFAIARVLFGYDSAFEIDPQQRAVLAFRGGTPEVIRFDAVQAVTVSTGSTLYTRGGELTGGQVAKASVMLLPMKVSLIHFKSDNAIGRAVVGPRAAAIAQRVAATIGVAVVEEPRG